MGEARPAPGGRQLEVRLRVAGPEELIRYVESHARDQGLFLQNPKPPPVGTALLIEVTTRGHDTRLAALHARVVEVTATPEVGMRVEVERIEPGCDEELRRTLRVCMAAPAAASGARDRGPVVGIDLGTTYSCVAIVDGEKPRVLASRLGYNTIPSVVTFDDRGLPAVGQPAERRMLIEPEHVVYGAKRLIGRAFSDGLVEQCRGRMRYEIVADAEGLAAARIDGHTLSPIEVGACVLSEIKKMAELELHQPISAAVVTVPAYFTENQRNATREAGARAGLHVLRILSEPTAAALAYGHGRNESKTILVYDLGGGTFDVSILELQGSLYSVLATAGDTFLGGLDIDRLLAARLEAELQQGHPGAVLDRVGHERLLVAAKDAKHTLSQTTRANLTLGRLALEGGRTVDFTAAITREELDRIVGPMVTRTLELCDQALRSAKLQPSALSDILLVGGQTRLPIVHDRLTAHFGRAPSRRVHPDEVVALGAALLATLFGKEEAPTLVDVLPVPIGYGDATGRFVRVLDRNVAIPATATVTLEAPLRGPLVVKIFQGDRPSVREAEPLGACAIPLELPPGAGRKVEVTFALSSECILTVRSKVLHTGEVREHHLVTQQTADETLARIGAERVGRQAKPAGPNAQPGAAASAPRGKGGAQPGNDAAAAKKRGWWEWLFRRGG